MAQPVLTRGISQFTTIAIVLKCIEMADFCPKRPPFQLFKGEIERNRVALTRMPAQRENRHSSDNPMPPTTKPIPVIINGSIKLVAVFSDEATS